MHNYRELCRLEWNKQEANLLATIPLDSDQVALIDVRMPGTPVSLLTSHEGAVNALAWAPHSDTHICTAADDNQALIWDIVNVPGPIDEPILAYQAPAPVQSLVWSSLHTDWVTIGVGKQMQFLRV